MQPSLGKMSGLQDVQLAGPLPPVLFEQTVAAFLEIGEAYRHPLDFRRPTGVLILANGPGRRWSGAIYLFDRQRELWHMLSFGVAKTNSSPENVRPRRSPMYDLVPAPVPWLRCGQAWGSCSPTSNGHTLSPTPQYNPTTNSTSTEGRIRHARPRPSKPEIRRSTRVAGGHSRPRGPCQSETPTALWQIQHCLFRWNAAEFVKVVVVPRSPRC